MTTPREHTEDQLSTADMVAATQNRPEAPVHEIQPLERRSEDRVEPERGQAPLFAANDAEGFRHKWSDVQASFVDEPRRAVEQADALVAEVMQRLAQVFADERRRLEQQWDRGGDTDTEELRLALRRYRSFFDRLLAM
jgi:hypothetical protein